MLEALRHFYWLPKRVVDLIRDCATKSGFQVFYCIAKHIILHVGKEKLRELGIPYSIVGLAMWLWNQFAFLLTAGISMVDFCANLDCLCGCMIECLEPIEHDIWYECCKKQLSLYCANPVANRDPMGSLQFCFDLAKR